MLTKLERLRVEIYPSGYGVPVFKYKCHCGNTIERLVTSVKDIKNAHCGCEFDKKFATRWKYGKQLKKRWNGINSRTINGNHPNEHKLHGSYKNVKICNEWKTSFKAFYDWSIENGFNPKLHIDRKDPKIGYEPDNCRWVTQQSNNRNGARSKISVIYAREILLLHGIYSSLDIAKIYDLSPSTLTNIVKGKLWKDVFAKYHTNKNIVRARPKFQLPIKKDIKPGTIDFNNDVEISRIKKGYLAIPKNTNISVINMADDFKEYSNLDTCNNNLENFHTLLETVYNNNSELDNVMQRLFVLSKDIIINVKDYINGLKVKYKYTYENRIDKTNYIIMSKNKM